MRLLPLRAILFDLDGTLLDTAPDMVGALNALRCEEGLAPLPYDRVRSAVSHGAARVVKTGFPEESSLSIKAPLPPFPVAIRLPAASAATPVGL